MNADKELTACNDKNTSQTTTQDHPKLFGHTSSTQSEMTLALTESIHIALQNPSLGIS